MKIARDRLLQELIRADGNGLIKIVTGLRRSGKSYLLFTLFAEHLRQAGVDEQHLVMLALDDRRNKAYRNPDVLLSYLDERMPAAGKTYILLDEVQLVEDFSDVLNSLLHYPGAEVYVTGSNSRFLSRDVLSSFRGRGHEIHVTPLSFAEWMQTYQGSPEQGVTEYMTYGGLPQVATLPRPEDKMKYLQALFANTYLADIKERYQIRADDDLEELINMIASGIGCLTNPRNLENAFLSRKKSKISAITIKRYMELLEDAFLVQKSTRYDIKGKRYIDTPFKYYFSDLGLRNARLNFRQFEETHLMENLIYNELRRRGGSVDVGELPHFSRNEQGQTQRSRYEVDFVCNCGHSRTYIQSAYRLANAEKEEQELRPLLLIKDSFCKALITMQPVPRHYNEQGILILSLLDFLMDETALPLA